MMLTLKAYFFTKMLLSLTNCDQIRASPTYSGGWGLRREPGNTSDNSIYAGAYAFGKTA